MARPISHRAMSNVACPAAEIDRSGDVPSRDRAGGGTLSEQRKNDVDSSANLAGGGKNVAKASA